jgi:hypothetical protein
MAYRGRLARARKRSGEWSVRFCRCQLTVLPAAKGAVMSRSVWDLKVESPWRGAKALQNTPAMLEQRKGRLRLFTKSRDVTLVRWRDGGISHYPGGSGREFRRQTASRIGTEMTSK